MTTVLEESKTLVYGFDKDDETKYGFRVTFKANDEFYTPFVSHSQASIGLFVNPIDFAETIQDRGAKYIITPNAIIFDDEASAHIAAEALTQEVLAQPIERTTQLLYNFAKEKYFGNRPSVVNQLAERLGLEATAISDIEVQNEFETFVTAYEGTLVAHHEEADYNIKSYDIATGILTAEDGTTLDVADCDLTY